MTLRVNTGAHKVITETDRIGERRREGERMMERERGN